MSAQKSARLGVVADVRPSGVDKKTVDGELPVRLCNYTDIYYGDRITTGQQFMAASATPAEVRSFTLRRGDVVITKDSETADDIAAAAYIDEDLPGVLLGYHCALIRPKAGVDGRFLYWLLQSSHMRDYFAQHARGVTRVGLRQEDIARAPVPLPPLNVQRHTAAFLDREVGLVDRAIEKNARMTSLLEERAKVVAVDALLSATPASTPEEFLVGTLGGARVKHLIRSSFAGNTPASDDPAWRDGVEPASVAWLGIGDFAHGTDAVRAGSWLDERSLSRLRLQAHEPGAVLFAMYGATAGKVSRLGIRATWNQAVLGLVSDHNKVDPDFFYLWLQIAGPAARSMARSNTQDNFNAEQVLNFRVPLPPRDVQREVARRIHEELGRQSTSTSMLIKQTELLLERRQALITAAVTGQLDLGEAA